MLQAPGATGNSYQLATARLLSALRLPSPHPPRLPMDTNIAEALRPIYIATEHYFPPIDLTQYDAETVDAIVESALAAVAEARK